MGDAFFAKRSYQEAREAYSKAFELRPDSTMLKNRIEQLDAIIRMQGK
jgi:predicted negative regulator of RcsB-dependent stress response